jgi:hypothetical protein
MTFEEFKKEMFKENVDERIAYGDPILQYKDYCSEYKEFLIDEYSKHETKED